MAGKKGLSGRKNIGIEKRGLLTTEGVALLTGLSQKSVRKFTDRKDGRQIPHYRFGTYRRYKKEDVLAWMERMKQDAMQKGGDDGN